MTFEQFLAGLSADERAAFCAMTEEGQEAVRADYIATEGARTMAAARARMSAPVVRTVVQPEVVEGSSETQARVFTQALSSGRALSSDDASAGALIPDEFVPEIMGKARKVFKLLSAGLIKISRMTRDAQGFPVRVNSVTSGDDAIGEGNTAETTEPSYTLVQLVAMKFGATIPVNEEVLADAPVDVIADLEDGIGQDIGTKLERHVLRGTGGDLQPQGITTHEDVEHVPGPEFNSDAEAYGAALDQALNSFYFGIEAGYRESDSFAFVAGSQLYALLNAARVGGAKLLSAPTNEKPFATLFGKPVIESAALTDGQLVAGDFSRYVLGWRQDVTVRMSDQANFSSDQVLVKYRSRWDGKVGVAEAFKVLDIELS
jgi:HK97 family phage major capsid protein